MRGGATCVSAVLVSTTLLLASCRGAPPPSLTPENRLQLSLSPKSFVDSLSVQQQVHVERDGRTVDFDAVLEVNPQLVTLVGLGFGQRLFTLRYDGTTLDETRSDMLPAQVKASDVLSDMQLALWPIEAIRASLPTGYVLRDEPLRRILAKGDAEIVLISYSDSIRWKGQLVINNKEFRYRLVIRTVPDSK